MATTDTPTGTIPKAIMDLIPGLAADASGEDAIARVQEINDAPRETLSSDELKSVDAVRRALLLPADASTQKVVAALRAKLATPSEASKAIARVALKMGLPDTATVDQIVATAHARRQSAAGQASPASRLEQAIHERRIFRTQRAAMLGLAVRDVAEFDRALAASTEIVGYETAEDEMLAGVQAYAHSAAQTGKKITFSEALAAFGREHPDLASEVQAEREGRQESAAAQAVRADQVLAGELLKLVAGGKTPYDAIQTLSRDHPDLVEIRHAALDSSERRPGASRA